MDTLISTLISTLSATLLSSGIALYISSNTNKKNEKKALDDHLMQINSLTIQYPYLEDEVYIASLDGKKNFSEKDQRYSAFCIIVFNFLERLCKHYNYNQKKINRFVHYKELIKTHGIWWSHPSNFKENLRGYDDKFVAIINEVIKE